MSAVTRTETFDQLYSLTAKARRKRISDNIGASQPSLDVYSANGRVEFEDGGSEIEEDLMYAYQDAEWMSDRQAVSTDDKEGVTKAIYPWRFCLAPINISWTDEQKAGAMNENQAMDFMESKIVMAREGLRTAINTAMSGAQSGKSMLGRQDIVADTVTSGTLAGINRATDTWWRNVAYTTSKTFTTQSITGVYDGWFAIGTNYESASDINAETTHIFMGSSIYQAALETLEGTGYTRYEAGKRGKMGVPSQSVGDGPAFRNAILVKDRAVPSLHVYGENLDTQKLKIMRGANFAKTPFVRADATGVLAKVSFVVAGIQFITINPRRNWVATAITGV